MNQNELEAQILKRGRGEKNGYGYPTPPTKPPGPRNPNIETLYRKWGCKQDRPTRKGPKGKT